MDSQLVERALREARFSWKRVIAYGIPGTDLEQLKKDVEAITKWLDSHQK